MASATLPASESAPALEARRVQGRGKTLAGRRAGRISPPAIPHSPSTA
jgi:hypothetical protein